MYISVIVYLYYILPTKGMDNSEALTRHLSSIQMSSSDMDDLLSKTIVSSFYLSTRTGEKIPNPDGVKSVLIILKYIGKISNRSVIEAMESENDDIIAPILAHPSVDIMSHNGHMLSQLVSSYPDKHSLIMESLSNKGQPIISFNTHQDILNAVSAACVWGRNVCICPVGKMFDPVFAIKCGLFPSTIDLGDPAITHYINGVDLRLITFFTTSDPEMFDHPFPYRLDIDPVWVYMTLNSHQAKGRSNAISLPLILAEDYQGQYVYPDSKRPHTNMSTFKNEYNYIISPSDIRQRQTSKGETRWSVILGGMLKDVLPVTRYSAGMKRGLYYDGEGESEPTGDQFCGTFYYYQDGSATLLTYDSDTMVMYRNKQQAIIDLLGLESSGVGRYPILDDYTTGKLNVPPDLMMSAAEVWEIRKNYNLNMDYDRMQQLDRYVSTLPDTKLYAGGALGLYAVEDYLDQLLCSAARSKGIQIILLTDMVGSHQIVAEVLDTRSRDDSFGSLVTIVS